MSDKNLIASVIALACLFLLLLLGTVMSAEASVTNWPVMYPLMADQHGNIVPAGYAAGLTEIANAEAQSVAARQAAQIASETTASASNIVDQIVTALTGAIGFGYVTGHVVSFAGSVEISTNAASQIVALQLGGAGTTNVAGVSHTGHYVWHVYSVSLNSYPAVKYKTNLDATNAWEFAELQSTAEFHETEIGGTTYPTVYRSTVWLPSSLDGAFFMAFTESTGGGQAGGYFDVQTGFKIGGKTGFTGDVIRDGRVFHYDCGALMTVAPTNGVPQ